MSPNHNSPHYCPIHGIEAMLTTDGVDEYVNDLVKAKRAVLAHLEHIKPSQVRKLEDISKKVAQYVIEASSADSADMAKRLAYMTLLKDEIDEALRTRGEEARK